MTDPQLDLTTQLGATLRTLDTLIQGELRPEIAEAVAVARRMLATSREPFGWRFIDLGARTLPEGIRSGAVFVLPAGTTPPRPSPSEFHPAHARAGRTGHGHPPVQGAYSPAGPGPVRRGNRATVAGHPARRRAPAGGLAGG